RARAARSGFGRGRRDRAGRRGRAAGRRGHRLEAAWAAARAGGGRMKTDTTRRHVLITDAGRGSAVAFIRSLGRRGWKVTAADHDPASAGFHSRFTTDKLLYPRPSEHPAALGDAILARVERDGIDLVVPITDELGLPLAEARDRFARLNPPDVPRPGAPDT